MYLHQPKEVNMNNNNVLFRYTYWNEVYKLIWNDLKKAIEKKLKTAENVNLWLINNDFTSTDNIIYGKKLSYYNTLLSEIGLLQAAWSFIPEYKKACDDYIAWLAYYRDSMNQELILEIKRLRKELHEKE